MFGGWNTRWSIFCCVSSPLTRSAPDTYLPCQPRGHTAMEAAENSLLSSSYCGPIVSGTNCQACLGTAFPTNYSHANRKYKNFSFLCKWTQFFKKKHLICLKNKVHGNYEFLPSHHLSHIASIFSSQSWVMGFVPEQHRKVSQKVSGRAELSELLAQCILGLNVENKIVPCVSDWGWREWGVGSWRIEGISACGT